MSVLTNKKDFFKVLQETYPIVPSRSSMQVLTNFKITLSNGFIEVVATDLDHSIKSSCKIEGDEENSIVVSAKRLFEIIRELKDGEIKLNFDENVLIIENEKSFTGKVSGSDPSEFPIFPIEEAKENFIISKDKLIEMVPKSSFAVSTDETRACLCGIYWEIDKEKTGMVATDGHRLGSSFSSGFYSVKDKISCIVSPKSLIQLTKIISSNDEENIKVSIGEKYVTFNTNNVTLCTKLIDGPYPDYDKVIPKSNSKKAILDKKNLKEAVRRVSVLSNQKTHLVRFSFTKDNLEIIVINRDIGGEAKEIIPITYEGEDIVIGLNSNYLYEILNIISSDTVRFEMNTQISACLIFGENNNEGSEDLYLIMPLRIMDE